MKVLFASSEIAPYASTGGLGEVSRSLPAALGRAGVDVVRIMPLYRHVTASGRQLEDTGLRLRIPVGFRMMVAEIYRHDLNGITTYFVGRDEYFDRRELYALPHREYTDNFERFVFFQKAVVALIDAAALAPDIVHGNDWTCGLIPMYLRHGINGMGRNGHEGTVFTVHNLAYQGIYPASEFPLSNLPFSCFSIAGLEFYGKINCLKGGLTSSLISTTVSPSYADEIRQPELGMGLDGVLRSLGDRFIGIRNGVDTDIWNPAIDPLIEARYSADNAEGKGICKRSLMAEAGFAGDDDVPLVAMISRLEDEKGLDLLAEVMPEIMSRPLQMVILGRGAQKYEGLCVEWMRRWPNRFHAWIGYNEALAHRIQSAADIYLMPSRLEPCGLSHLYALKYGALPIVRSTGGLKDSVQALSDDTTTGNGVVFTGLTGAALLEALDRGLAIRKSGAWSALQRRLMLEDHSWEKPVTEYQRVYNAVFASPR